MAIDAGNGPQAFRVVAEVMAPAVLGPEADLDTGGVMLLEAGTELLGGRAEDNVVNAFLVRLRGGEGDRADGGAGNRPPRRRRDERSVTGRGWGGGTVLHSGSSEPQAALRSAITCDQRSGSDRYGM